MFGLHSKNALDLSNKHIECDRLKHLAQELKDTEITELNLKNCNLGNEDVKYVVEALKDTKITTLDLRENEIGCDAAKYLNEMLSVSSRTVSTIYLDIYYAEGADVKKYISQNCSSITLHNNKIGNQGAEYINKTFQNTGISDLKLDRKIEEADDAQYLAQAFEGIKICNLFIFKHQMSLSGIYYLTQAFKGSRIISLNLENERIGSRGAKLLATFLEEIKVLKLFLHYNFLRDEGMEYLAPVLKNSDVMCIGLSKNYIKSEGAQYLANILPKSKIIYINLCHNQIGADGAKYLAGGLRNSQVTGIHLHGNKIENEGYQYLADVAVDTNISWVNLHDNWLDSELEDVSNLPRNNSTIAHMLCHAFKELVSLNPVSNELEFIAPKKDAIDIDQYALIVKTLNNNSNSKVHIFEMMCKKVSEDYDLIMMDKINEFTAAVIRKFCSFIENKLPELIESFGNSSNNYKLVKQFEEMGYYNVVENLLLHRMLYYVDEDQEILHPYIYKMLAKYNMPVYSEQLEPDKKNEIILYCRENLEVEGAQEVINLLELKSFQKKDSN